MSRVLVTGGAGYIGSHTSKLLAREGFDPIVLDDLSTGCREFARWGAFLHQDLGDVGSIARALKQYDVRAVIHFAASAYVGESIQRPSKYFRNNVLSTMNLLEAMNLAGVRSLVFSSSCATYGIPAKLPIREDDNQVPVNPYGESKLFCEKMARWHQVAHDLRTVSLRYFNAAGADPDGEIGELHDPETHLIPLALRAALTSTELCVFGTDYSTADGTAIRDYVHVCDLASAHVAALRYLLGGGVSVALNLGSGKGASVREVVEMVQRVADRPVKIKCAARREGDPPMLVADASRAQETLNWAPTLSDLNSIVDTAWRWLRLRTET